MKTRLSSIVIMVMMMALLMAGVALAQGKVDINKADVKELMSLKGIGEQKAKAIVKYRQMNGPFQSLDDLQGVPGIGEKTIADNKGMIAIGKGKTGKKSTAKGGKAKAKDAKKAMSGSKEKAKKSMAGSKETGKKAMSGSKEKAKKAMTDTAEKAKKATSKKK